MRKTNSLVILLGAILILSFIGSRISKNLGSTHVGGNETEDLEKFNEIVSYVSSFYVDDVEWNKTIQGAIDGLLSGLDPHSVYISSQDAKLNEESFQGKYEGIGIQYDVIDGYLTVITPIPGSPSDKLGLLPGDKIIAIDGISAIGISSSDVPKKLKGPKGTSVDITVMREGTEDPLDFTIVRDDIPIFTINTTFLSEDSTGYISLGRFAKITEDEMSEALGTLNNQGMKRLILDLRWNAGGFLDQAVKLASQFIAGHKKIVYTEGRLKDFDEEFYTDTFNHRKVYEMPLIILINNASASASEIVAGAIQDYDRGLIIGTTSFGKGLVQREFPLNDNSKLRLTISKYYTPSGRLIQRPYKGKEIDQYYASVFDSAQVVATEDSVAARPVFHTSKGRKVFGGGGISPDVAITYISMDKVPALSQKFFQKRLFFEVASRYAKNNKYLEESFSSYLKTFKINQSMLTHLEELAIEKDIEFSRSDFRQNAAYFKSRLKAEIARSLWGTEKYYQVLLLYDNQYNEARKLFFQAEELLNGTEFQKMRDNVPAKTDIIGMYLRLDFARS
jgi:carboxyl-terminal processing protease